ncbi:hypothetical protein [Lacisediminihabitans sp.]|jgi:hypothetical protein|uniref:hypothetical protein n=1 Tax=Lacisediminihabitans sp. TaxID=2787631 RepID=UPI002F93D4DD
MHPPVAATRAFIIGCALGIGIGPAMATEAVAAAVMPSRTIDSTAPAPEPGIGVRLIDVPASVDDPRARVYIVDHLAPGSVVDRRIEVTNTGASGVRVALYPGAATIADGAFLGQADRTANDLSTWVSLDVTAFDIPGSGSARATVRIATPTDAAPGEHYGVVWAEVRSAPADGGGITEVSRVGIRIYLSVGQGGAPAPDFAVDSLTPGRTSDGRPTVIATVRNTGGRALDMFGELNLEAGPGGLRAGPFAAELGTTVGIGQTEPVTITLDREVPAGPWEARITLRSGLLERSAQATITFPDTGTSPPVVTTTTPPAWVYPAIAAMALLLLLLAVLLFRFARRWRRRVGPGEGSRHLHDRPSGRRRHRVTIT